MAVVFGGILCAYMQNGYRAEWAGYNLSAQAQAIQMVEEAKSAKWDDSSCELTNLFPGNLRITTNLMDLPISGTNRMYVTNYGSLTWVTISSNPPAVVAFIKVDAVWKYRRKDTDMVYTNTVATYFAKDQ